MVDFKALETFLWVARQQSFRAASERLNTTQPAISQRIAGLENALGVDLLHRTTRRVILTANGRVLLDYADRLMALRSEMIAAVGDPKVRSGTLRLGVAETIVHTWLPRLIERTAQVFPRLTLEIEVNITPTLAALLAGRELDLAVMVGPATEPLFRTRELCRYPVGFVASPRLDLPAKRLTVSEIVQQTIVTFTRNTRPYADMLNLIAQSSAGPARIHASASLATIVRMALDGLGIAAIPPVIVAEELARGRLYEVATDARLPDLHFYAAWLDAPDADILQTIVGLAADVAAEPSAHGRRNEKEKAKEKQNTNKKMPVRPMRAGGPGTASPKTRGGRGRSRPS